MLHNGSRRKATKRGSDSALLPRIAQSARKIGEALREVAGNRPGDLAAEILRAKKRLEALLHDLDAAGATASVIQSLRDVVAELERLPPDQPPADAPALWKRLEPALEAITAPGDPGPSSAKKKLWK